MGVVNILKNIYITPESSNDKDVGYTAWTEGGSGLQRRPRTKTPMVPIYRYKNKETNGAYIDIRTKRPMVPIDR
jgi:hypothetical protein